MRKDGWCNIVVKEDTFKLVHELMQAVGDNISVIVLQSLQLYEKEYCGSETDNGKILSLLRNKDK